MGNIDFSGKLTPSDKLLLEKLYTKFTRLLKRKVDVLSLSLVDENEMKKLNKRFFGINKPTDVLSFENIEEIIICKPIAKIQASKEKKKLIDELALLFVHGCLHIAGFDHDTEKNAKKMEILQKKILGKISNRQLEYNH